MIEKNAALYDVTQNLQGLMLQAANTVYQAGLSEEARANRPPLPPLMQLRAGYAESPGWVMVQMVEFAPEPLTVEKFRKRAVYSAPRLSLALLELLASEKWLDRIGDEYHLTDAGRDVIMGRFQLRSQICAGFEPIEADLLHRLDHLLTRILEASLASATPPGTWCLAYSRRRAPSSDAPILYRLIHHMSDLNAFRDDAHMAAYSAHQIEGFVWEAFNFVHAGQANSAESLFDQLAYRGFSCSDWSDSLEDLSARGWIVPMDSAYQVAEKGREVFRQVEAQTDAYFYAPWDVLNRDETEELISLLMELESRCRAIFSPQQV